MNLVDGRLKQLGRSDVSADGRTLVRCRVAADHIHKGQFEEAREALGDLWRGVGVRPNVGALEETTAAEVLLQCGSLTGYLGTGTQAAGAQGKARDMLGEARRLFEAHGLQSRAAEAEYELGVCYWRAGALDEARLILQEAVHRLGPGDAELKAKILIHSTAVEVSAGRYHDALRIINEAEPVFDLASDALKGRWHAQSGLVLRRLGAAQGRTDYLDRAAAELTAAIYHFEQAHRERDCAHSLNNLAPLLAGLGRYEEAHEHLGRARQIFTRLDDSGNLARVGETRARIFLAEDRYGEAAEAIGDAVVALEKAGDKASLADALTVQATIEAKLGRHDLSLPTFRRAIKVAEEAGAHQNAGLTLLSLIEEHGATRLFEEEVYEAYRRADELLQDTQDAEAIARLRVCARIVAHRLAEASTGDNFTLPEVVRAYEARFIQRALEDAGGSVTRAAKLLGMSYQSLIYLLESRHRDLLPARRPVQKRRRGIIKDKKK